MEPASRGELEVRIASELLERARAEGVSLVGQGGLLSGVTRQVLQAALEAELAEHLGYEKGEGVGRAGLNVRNGSSPKTVRTEVGDVRLEVPRDRDGSFEPAIVPKHARRLAGFDEAVVSLYAKGLTTGEIQAHLEQVYDVEVSRSLVSRVTERVAAELEAWRSRPLDGIYAVMFVDCIYVKVREGTVANRPIYVAVGVNLQGDRDVLGLWVGTGGEGAKHWLSVLSELKARGIADVMILCCDGLKGLPESVGEVWPRTTVQTCVVHLMRNTFRYTSKQDWGKIARDLKNVYQAPTAEAAEAEFAEFREAWGQRYPAVVKLWSANWELFTPFLSLPVEIRRLVYTTNAIESLNARFRQATRRRGHFPDSDAALKVLYLVIQDHRPNRSNVTGKTNGWKSVINALNLYYDDRITLN
ncbi:MAG: IS256 family transposase [Actinocrinis sp.]